MKQTFEAIKQTFGAEDMEDKIMLNIWWNFISGL